MHRTCCDMLQSKVLKVHIMCIRMCHSMYNNMYNSMYNRMCNRIRDLICSILFLCNTLILFSILRHCSNHISFIPHFL